MKLSALETSTEGFVEGYGIFYHIRSGTKEERLDIIKRLGAEIASAEDIAVGRLSLDGKQPMNNNAGQIREKIVYMPASMTHKNSLTLLVKNSRYDDKEISADSFFDDHKEGQDYIILKDSDFGPYNTKDLQNHRVPSMLFSGHAANYGLMLADSGIKEVAIAVLYRSCYGYGENIKVSGLCMDKMTNKAILADCAFIEDTKKYKEHHIVYKEYPILISDYPIEAIHAIRRVGK